MKRLLVGCLSAALIVAAPGTAESQWSKIKDLDKIPGIDDFLAKKPPLTTSLEDAVTEVPFLDDYHGLGTIPLSSLPRATDGTFFVSEPGHYMIEGQSYCLKAGTYGPSKGDGYLLARLKGPWSGIVRNVLRRSTLHPEIDQREIQLLLWAIIARTKIEDMRPETRTVAAKLLDPEELLTVNGGAMGLVPDSVWRRGMASLPPEVRRIRQVEAELRAALTSGARTYEEIEEIAVLAGEPPPQEGDRVVPAGRWSYHLNGYFVRFQPFGYSKTRVEIHVPAPVKITRDAEGRITRLVDRHGCKIEAAYGDDGNADSGPVRACGFKSVRYERPADEIGGAPLTTSWVNRGWTLVGHSAEDSRGGELEAGFPGAEARYRRALEHTAELRTLEDGIRAEAGGASSGAFPAEGIETLVNLAHLSFALEDLTSTGPDTVPEWHDFQAHLIKAAWQWSLVETMGTARQFPPDTWLTIEAARKRSARLRSHTAGAIVYAVQREETSDMRLVKSEEGDEGDSDLGIDLSGDDAQPGRGGSQRLGQSNRGTGMDSECAGHYGACKEDANNTFFKCTAPCIAPLDEDEAEVDNDCFDRCSQDYDHHWDFCKKKAQHCLEGGGW